MAAKEVDVYPDVNFTLAPVVIERAITEAPTRAYPDQVTLVHGQVINKTQVLLTWKSTGAQNIVYSVYRSGEALNNPEAVRKAERVAVITEAKESYMGETHPDGHVLLRSHHEGHCRQRGHAARTRPELSDGGH